MTPDYRYLSCKSGIAKNTCSWTQCQDDDVAFTLDLIRCIESKLCIDPKRVFAAGGSNGGMFVWELGQNPASASTFAALAPIIGLPHRAYLGGRAGVPDPQLGDVVQDPLQPGGLQDVTAWPGRGS